MKRLIYIQDLSHFLQSNTEMIQLLPTELLNEIHYFQRFQYKILRDSV